MNNEKHRRYLTTAIVAVSLLFAVPSMAANETMLELLKVLYENGTINQQAYALLRDTARAEGTPTAAISNEPATEDTEEMVAVSPAAGGSPELHDATKIETKGKLEISQGEDWKWRIGGRIQHDITLVNADHGIGGTSEHQFRRARLYMQGTAWRYWDWKFQYDFEDADDASQSIEDAYLRYTKFKPLSITIGQTKAPFSLEGLTSSKYITFIERSVPGTMVGSAAIGIAKRSPGISLASYGNDLWSAAGGFFTMRQIADANDSITERKIDDGLGFTGRLTLSPLHEKTKVLHVGIAGGYKHYVNGGIGRLSARPAVSEGDRIVDTNAAISAGEAYILGFEGAGVWGPLSLQGEYFHASFVDRPSGAGEYGLRGFYLYGSYYLTGESRRYNWKKGVFDSTKVHKPLFAGGPGAWELGLRFSSTDLDDDAFDGIGGDDAEVLTAALNWYVNNNIMFKLNYVTTFCGDGNCDWGSAEPDYFIFRTQFYF